MVEGKKMTEDEVNKYREEGLKIARILASSPEFVKNLPPGRIDKQFYTVNAIQKIKNYPLGKMHIIILDTVYDTLQDEFGIDMEWPGDRQYEKPRKAN